jgi:hypothetical protein
MSGVSGITKSRNEISSGEIYPSSASKVQDAANHRVRNLIIIALVMEVAFLATLATYELSSIFRFQN